MAKILPGFLNTVSTDGRTVQKRFQEERLVKIPPTRRYGAELRAHHLYAHHPLVRLPHLYAANPQTLTITMEGVPGTTRADALKAAGEAEQKTLARQAGAILRAIHTPAPVQAKPQVYLRHFFQQTEQKLRTNHEKFTGIGIEPEEILHKMQELIHPEEAKKDGVVYVHRDYSMRNILYDPVEKQMRVIDWEESGIGLAYEDSLIALRLEEQFPQIIQAFWQGYGKTPDRPTLLGYLLGTFTQLYATADAEYLQSMSSIAGVNMQASFTHSIRTLLAE
jgi:aminoglycoside phosphotransferase (APT) family kinase protein